jgi:hypothetical protein
MAQPGRRGYTRGRGMLPLSLPLAATVELRAEDYLRNWDEEASRLFVSARLEARAGARAAIRIGIHGTGIASTVMGTIVAVRRAGSRTLPPGIALALDEHGRSAARYLALVARGRPVDWNEREPRYAFERRVTIAPPWTDPFDSTTVNVSDSGCCVRWPGRVPAVGEMLRLRPGAFLAAFAGATVCWAATSGAWGDAAGLRVQAIGRAARAWHAIVEHAARSGAPLV